MARGHAQLQKGLSPGDVAGRLRQRADQDLHGRESREKDDAKHRKKHDLRLRQTNAAIELYDVKADPGQTENIAYLRGESAAGAKALLKQMTDELIASEDPRALNRGDQTFDPPPYLGGGPKHPAYEAIQKRIKAQRKKKK